MKFCVTKWNKYRTTVSVFRNQNFQNPTLAKQNDSCEFSIEYGFKENRIPQSLATNSLIK